MNTTLRSPSIPIQTLASGPKVWACARSLVGPQGIIAALKVIFLGMITRTVVNCSNVKFSFRSPPFVQGNLLSTAHLAVPRGDDLAQHLPVFLQLVELAFQVLECTGATDQIVNDVLLQEVPQAPAQTTEITLRLSMT